MRFRVVCLLLVSGLICAATAPVRAVDAQARDDVRKVFAAVAASREATVAKTSLPVKPPSPYYGAAVMLESEMVRLLSRAMGSESSPGAKTYREAIVAELSSKDPKSRGLACELAAFMFSPDVIRALGQLIDDSAPTVPALHQDEAQQGPGFWWWTRPTVGQVATMALHAVARMGFSTKADFDDWWKANCKYEDKLWYWSAKWSRRYLTYMAFEGERPTRDWHAGGAIFGPDNSPADLQGLSRLSPDVALKILLLSNNVYARQMEIDLSLDPTLKRPRRVRVSEYTDVELRYQEFSGFPDAAVIASFVNERRLQARLIGLLDGKDVYPEAQGEAYPGLVVVIGSVGEKVFGPDDEPALAGLQEKNGANIEYVQTLAILRSKVVPESGAAILSKTLRGNPRMSRVGRALLLTYGAEDPSALTTAFEQCDKHDQGNFADSIQRAASAHLPITPAFLADIVDRVTEPHETGDMDCFRTLSCLAKAANTVKGTEIISEQELAGMRVPGKVSREEAEAQMPTIIEAFTRVKQNLLTALRSQ